MTSLVAPGAGLVFMKVGTHAREPLDEIIKRKTLEIERAGFALWGYGGNTCHPQTMVQPFAKSFVANGKKIYLCMQPMESKHFAPRVRADDYSVDGVNWKPIHPAIDAVGSRYALVIKDLRSEQIELPLEATRVAVGRSAGASGDTYIRGRVDKACLEVTGEMRSTPKGEPIGIELVAEIVEPFAVYLRNNLT